MSESIILGVDIGGSHISTALVNLETNQILDGTFFRKQVESNTGVNEIITAWGGAIKEGWSHTLPEGKKIGIAIPGPFEYENGISLVTEPGKYDSLYGLNVKQLLADELGMSPSDIKTHNDAECFLMGEVLAGAAKGSKDAIGVTLGTGIGTARYHRGKAKDANLWSSPFHASIAEEYLSTRWFIKRYKELSGQMLKGVKELSGLVGADPNANSVFLEFAKNLALFLEDFVLMDNPEVIVVGGNISNSFAHFFPETERVLSEKSVLVPLRQAGLGEIAAILGAAYTWNKS